MLPMKLIKQWKPPNLTKISRVFLLILFRSPEPTAVDQMWYWGLGYSSWMPDRWHGAQLNTCVSSLGSLDFTFLWVCTSYRNFVHKTVPVRSWSMLLNPLENDCSMPKNCDRYSEVVTGIFDFNFSILKLRTFLKLSKGFIFHFIVPLQIYRCFFRNLLTLDSLC